MKETILILGGARSGKSRFAEEIVMSKGKKPIYIATAQAFDEEMRQRINQHQRRRADKWQTIEAPFELVEAIEQVATEKTIILVDCLTLWLSNLMLARAFSEKADAGSLQKKSIEQTVGAFKSNNQNENHSKSDIETACNALCALVAHPPCEMVLVANEVGLGIVPDNALARQFRDAAGLLNQHIAAVAKTVYFVAAGLPLRLKG